MLLARTDPDRSAGHRGLSVFVVDKEPAPGHAFAFTQDGGGTMEGRAIDTLGYRGMHSYEVAFADWFVPAENLVGEAGGLGKGFYLQMEGFENGRLQTAARAVGLMQAAFEAGLAYAQDREVFGRPVFAYQLSRAKLARMAFLIQAGRQFAYDVAAQMGRGEGTLAASMVKAYVCRAAEWVTRRSDATARRHGVRRGVRRIPLLRRRACPVDLRRRRRDAVPPGDRPSPRRGSPRGVSAMTSPIAIDELYSRYSGLVLGYLRGQGAVDPEDLASEVFVGVLRGLDRFDGDEAAFRSWLMVIAHRRLLDDRRRRGRKPADAVQPHQLYQVPDRGRLADVEGAALERLGTDRVRAALDRLTDDQRTVVLLHTVGGLKLPQIAEMLGKRLAAVKSLHRRGLAAAARALDDASDHEVPR